MTKSVTSSVFRIAFLAVATLFIFSGVVAHAATATVAPGKKVTLSVSANGTSPFDYQWKKNGVDIGGANASTYVIASVQIQHAGNYTVAVSNSAGATTSDIGTLIVQSVPVITAQPINQTVVAGGAVTFIATASGTPVPTYQWQKDGVDISGATDISYNIASVTIGNAGNYRVIASNAAGSTSSDVATLTVQTVPSIATQPSLSQTIIYGNTVTFTVAASGVPAPTYQWRKNGVDISGATGSSYTINAAQFSDIAAYSVVITNAAGSVVSSDAALTVIPNWRIGGTGDFDGDGQIDILWRKASTGAVALWLMNGTAIQSTLTFANISAEWSIAGTGDLNGDGDIDILWRKASTGAVALWLMNGTTIQSTPTFGNISAEWSIAGTGDFNGDGDIDILWRKASTGAVALWLMNGTTIQSTPTFGNISAEWSIGGTGDFDGDGQIDILWRKASNGAVALWLMNGTTVQSTPIIANISAEWSIAGTGDFNGDGDIDILWRKASTGAVALWLMNGTSIQSTQVIGTVF